MHSQSLHFFGVTQTAILSLETRTQYLQPSERAFSKADLPLSKVTILSENSKGIQKVFDTIEKTAGSGGDPNS